MSNSLKSQVTQLKDENLKLKTRNKFLEAELAKADKTKESNPKFVSTIGLKRLYSDTKLAL